MTPLAKSRIDDFGKVFRLITPSMVLILGWISCSYYSALDRRFERWDTKIENIDRRVVSLETRILGKKYQVLEDPTYETTSALDN